MEEFSERIGDELRDSPISEITATSHSNEWVGILDFVRERVEKQMQTQLTIKQELRSKLYSDTLRISPISTVPLAVSDNDLSNARDKFRRAEIVAADGSKVSTELSDGEKICFIRAVTADHRSKISISPTKCVTYKSPFSELTLRDLEPNEYIALSNALREGEDFAERYFRRQMIYEERALLLNSKYDYVIAHGAPISYDVFTSNHDSESEVDHSVTQLIQLVKEKPKFAFVPSETVLRGFELLANSLDPRSFAIFDLTAPIFTRLASNFKGSAFEKLNNLATEVGQTIVVGGFKAAPGAPGRLFYAHRNHAEEIGTILIADSLLTGTRGFPYLIGLADMNAKFFSQNFLRAQVLNGLSKSSAVWEHMRERETRK